MTQTSGIEQDHQKYRMTKDIEYSGIQMFQTFTMSVSERKKIFYHQNLLGRTILRTNGNQREYHHGIRWKILSLHEPNAQQF